VASKTDIEELKLLLNTQFETSVSAGSITHAGTDASRLTLVLTIPNSSISTREMAAILRHFSTEIEVVLKVFFANFLVSLKDLLLALPQLIMLYRILQRLPQAISLVVHDNITIKDALGRVQSLQFQQLKHWKVFEASLRCTFELVPGKQKVIRSQYVLTSPDYKGHLTPQNWSIAIRSGLIVKMAIMMTNVFAEGRN
jgi:hypothetical protein